MKQVYGEIELKKQIWLNQDKAIIITGGAGTGKTSVVVEAAEQMGVTPIVYRMQGIDSTDVAGIPSRNEETHSLEYLKPRQIKQIIDNPQQRFLLLLDEVNRCTAEMQPILFQLFEKKIESVYYPNLIVVACINIGKIFAA